MRAFNHFGGAIVCLAFCAGSFVQGQEPAYQEVEISDAEIVSDAELLPPATRVEPDRTRRGTPGGRGMGGGMGGPGMGAPGYKVTWYPTTSVTNGAGDLGLVRQSLSGAFPLWRNDGDMVMLMGGLRNTLFSTDAILPDSLLPFPSELWNISLGVMYMHQFDNGWSSGVSTNFGSASDKPFHSIEEMNVGFFGFLRVPARNDRDAWTFSLMYSPVGNLTFPIPGVSYFWRPTDELDVSIGLPFSINWRPIEGLALTASYIPITNVNARATYQLFQGLSVYSGFEWLNEAYFLADRTEEKERFLAFEKRLVTGVQWDIWTHAALDINAGYAFDRYYGQGENQISDLEDRVNIRAGAFLGANLLLRW